MDAGPLLLGPARAPRDARILPGQAACRRLGPARRVMGHGRSACGGAAADRATLHRQGPADGPRHRQPDPAQGELHGGIRQPRPAAAGSAARRAITLYADKNARVEPRGVHPGRHVRQAGFPDPASLCGRPARAAAPAGDGRRPQSHSVALHSRLYAHFLLLAPRRGVPPAAGGLRLLARLLAPRAVDDARVQRAAAHLRGADARLHPRRHRLRPAVPCAAADALRSIRHVLDRLARGRAHRHLAGQRVSARLLPAVAREPLRRVFPAAARVQPPLVARNGLHCAGHLARLLRVATSQAPPGGADAVRREPHALPPDQLARQGSLARRLPRVLPHVSVSRPAAASGDPRLHYHALPAVLRAAAARRADPRLHQILHGAGGGGGPRVRLCPLRL
mmetsp:Transcript_33265/g.106129  ORF Transcript_33265/g.106129 Transcript_33265/m.106129 type:complete len:393 (+) Transcript_33265:453-1631(+)